MSDPKFINIEYFFRKLVDLLRGVHLSELWAWLVLFLERISPFIKLLCALLAFGSVWYFIQKRKVDKKQERQLDRMCEEAKTASLVPAKNQKWERVIDHINSTNQNDWKAAIIEAYIMLDELLTVLNYHGSSIGEKLKAIEPSDFETLQAAWEAHKVRNQIAHEGSNFVLSEREAKRVIGLYRSVFTEFEFI